MRGKELLIISMYVFCMAVSVRTYSQVNSDERRYIRVGSLQSFVSSYGTERAWNNSYYEGLEWPAQYQRQDNFVIDREWLACRNFTDQAGNQFDYYGLSITPGFAGVSVFPVVLKQSAKSPQPEVWINGENYTNLDVIDEYNPDQEADRIVTNVVNTSMGLTMTRRILAFANSDHDNYFIKEYTYKNTGNTDYDDEIELTDTLKAVRIGRMPRYSTCRDGALLTDAQQTWGKYSWVTKRGEDYAQHSAEIIPDDFTIASWIRCGFSWAGQSERISTYDNIGAPAINKDGRLMSPQHAGIAILHVDKSAKNKDDDPTQPATLGWHGGDTYPFITGISLADSAKMRQLYTFLGGIPYGTGMGGTDRMDETNLTSIVDRKIAYTVHGDGGGTGVWICYGDFDLAPGESVTIVEVEAVSGLSRPVCETVGRAWKKAKDDPNNSFNVTWPDKSVSGIRYADQSADRYKNQWFYTGMDSLLLTFSRAKRNYDNHYQIPDPPPPPQLFEVYADSQKIYLTWSDEAAQWTHFKGYRLYRADGRYDTTYQKIFECGGGTNHPEVVTSYQDTTVIYGVDYYYYLTAFDNGYSGQILESNLLATLMKYHIALTEGPCHLADLYVSNQGSDQNDGLSSATPLKTITAAMNSIIAYKLRPRKLFLAEGIYSPTENEEMFPIMGKSYVTIIGAGSGNTIIDGEQAFRIFVCVNVDTFSLQGLTIQNGKADVGAGLYCIDATLKLSDVTIRNNGADQYAGGIYCNYVVNPSEIIFDKNHLCNIYHNTADLYAADIYFYGNTQEITLDTFTVATPTDYHFWTNQAVNLNIQNSKIIQKNADLYVSPDGSNENSGISGTEPFKSIRHAIEMIYADQANPHTIHLLPGTYRPSSEDTSKRIRCRSYVSLQGNGPKNTILDSICVFSDYDTLTSISNLTVKNAVYGLDCSRTNLTAQNLVITRNQKCGFFAYNANLALTGCIIENNAEGSNGGLVCRGGSKVNLSDVTIRYNKAYYASAGIQATGGSQVIFDPNNRCNIYCNESTAGLGNDLSSDQTMAVVLDTFTYLYPYAKVAYPLENFTFDIRTGMIPQIPSDIYVAVDGSDSNNGVTEQTPFQTITHALELIIADNLNPRTIFLKEGTYSSGTNGETFPISLIKDHITIVGISDSLTIIDGEKMNQIFTSEQCTGVKLKNLTLKNGSAEQGGALNSYRSKLNLQNVTLTDDSSKYGGAIYCNYSSIGLDHVLIKNNIAKYGAAIYSSGTSDRILLSNCTVGANQTTMNNTHIYSSGDSANIFITNSVLWNSNSRQIRSIGVGSKVIVAYSDIFNGQESIAGSPLPQIIWSDGNLNSDPQFLGGDPFDYHITPDSPCKGTGATIFVYEGDTLVNLDEISPNIGALSVRSPLGIIDDNVMPRHFALYPNFPNPFNPTTEIRYDLPQSANAKLIVYDLAGRQVRTIVNDHQNAGYYNAIWDGKDRNGNSVASGIYIYRLTAGNFNSTRKMVLLK